MLVVAFMLALAATGPVPPLVAAAGSPQAATAPPGLAAVLRQIQNVCFAAYPADLLEAMSGRPGRPPEEVLRDPALQMKYLSAEKIEAQGLFYPSLLDEIAPGVMAYARPGTRFLDLGSGDGRVVFMAALLGAEATGIEYDRSLHRVAGEALARLEGVVPRERVRLRRGDFFRHDWSRYDVLFYFGKGSFAETRLLEKAGREMSPGAVLLLAHGPDPPAGFGLAGEHGVLRAWKPEKPGAAGDAQK
jgi:SAM-dependent methyltransferase